MNVNQRRQSICEWTNRGIYNILQQDNDNSLDVDSDLLREIISSNCITNPGNILYLGFEQLVAAAIGTTGGLEPREITVPFHSIRQSRVTDPSKSPKCHGGNGDFCWVPNSPSDPTASCCLSLRNTITDLSVRPKTSDTRGCF